MKIAVLLTCLAVTAHGANHQCWTVDQIADEVIRQTDTNRDGVITREEFSRELIDKWNLSNDSCLSFHDFTTNWVANYHDFHDTAHTFFNNLDLNDDDRLCLLDVAVQLITFDNNPTDGVIQPAEFKAFLHAMHPDSHVHGGHPGAHCQ